MAHVEERLLQIPNLRVDGHLQPNTEGKSPSGGSTPQLSFAGASHGHGGIRTLLEAAMVAGLSSEPSCAWRAHRRPRAGSAVGAPSAEVTDDENEASDAEDGHPRDQVYARREANVRVTCAQCLRVFALLSLRGVLVSVPLTSHGRLWLPRRAADVHGPHGR